MIPMIYRLVALTLTSQIFVGCAPDYKMDSQKKFKLNLWKLLITQTSTKCILSMQVKNIYTVKAKQTNKKPN